MITLWIAAGFMLLAALVLVLPPLLANRPAAALDQQDANVAIFRRRLAELESDLQAGQLSEADATEARLELERQLLGDLGEQHPATPRLRPAYLTALAVVLLLPLTAILLYLQLGSPAAVEPFAAASIPQDEQGQMAFIAEHLADLEAKVQAEPDDLEGVVMLGRAYLLLQRYDAAVALYAAAEQHLGDQPALLADYAEGLAYAQGGNLLGRPTELLQRALTMEPAYPKALWLAGLAAMQAEQPEQARQYWQRLMAVLPAESTVAEQVRELLAEIDEPAAAATTTHSAVASLQVEVSLAPELEQRLAAGSTVFVLARPASGQRAPLAVVRQPAERLPLQVTLDESMAMVPGMSLREFPEVVVEARISRSGAAASQAGDLLGRSLPITVVAATGPVRIVIDQVVE